MINSNLERFEETASSAVETLVIIKITMLYTIITCSLLLVIGGPQQKVNTDFDLVGKWELVKIHNSDNLFDCVVVEGGIIEFCLDGKLKSYNSDDIEIACRTEIEYTYEGNRLYFIKGGGYTLWQLSLKSMESIVIEPISFLEVIEQESGNRRDVQILSNNQCYELKKRK